MGERRQLKIGDLTIEHPYVLAPMAGVTDLPFRLLCKEQGAGLLCMEMVSAKALQYRNRNTKALLSIHPEEYPVSLQLFGSEPEVISEQAKAIEELPFQILDINMGCPVPKVVKNGEGSALMRQPRLVHEIVSLTDPKIKDLTGFTSRQIMDRIIRFFGYADIHVPKEGWKSYERLNQEILAAMSRVPDAEGAKPP